VRGRRLGDEGDYPHLAAAIGGAAWIEKAKLKPEQYLFHSRVAKSPHVSTRQYARVVH